jgi:hypothetical protein
VQREGPRFDPARGDSCFALLEYIISCCLGGNQVVAILVEICDLARIVGYACLGLELRGYNDVEGIEGRVFDVLNIL